MALRPSYELADPSHRLYRGPNVSETTAVAAENAVIEATSLFGSHAHVAADADALAADAPAAMEAFRSLAPVLDDERALYGDEERVGRLPEDAETVMRVFGDPIGSDDPLDWRAFDIDALLVRDGERALYHSIPHESHVREVYATDAPAYREAVRDAVSESLGVALYPAEPLLTWRVRETSYELTPTTLRYGAGDDRHGYSLDRLVAAEPTRGGHGVDCEWRSLTATARDPIQRALGRVHDVFASDPPETVPTDDVATTEAVLGALSDLAGSLDYDCAVSPRRT